MRRFWFAAAGAASVVTASALAKPLPDTGTPAQVQSLLACRSVTDSAQRLTCYDRAAQGFAEAVGKKEVVVIDKARATQARRSLFGFTVPNLGSLFGGGGDEISQIEGIVQNVIENGDGSLVITLADGSTWSQIDDTPVALPPRRGDKIVVRRGALGAYFVKIGSQPGYKAKRVG
jgi:hypothetical protein